MKIPTHLQVVCILALTKGASAYFYDFEDTDDEVQETNYETPGRSWWDWAVGNKIPEIPIAEPFNEKMNVISVEGVPIASDDAPNDNIVIEAVVPDTSMFTNPLIRNQNEFDYILDFAKEGNISADQLAEARKLIESEKRLTKNVQIENTKSAEDDIDVTDIYKDSNIDMVQNSIPDTDIPVGFDSKQRKDILMNRNNLFVVNPEPLGKSTSARRANRKRLQLEQQNMMEKEKEMKK